MGGENAPIPVPGVGLDVEVERRIADGEAAVLGVEEVVVDGQGRKVARARRSLGEGHEVGGGDGGRLRASTDQERAPPVVRATRPVLTGTKDLMELFCRPA